MDVHGVLGTPLESSVGTRVSFASPVPPSEAVRVSMSNEQEASNIESNEHTDVETQWIANTEQEISNNKKVMDKVLDQLDMIWRTLENTCDKQSAIM